MGIYWCAINYDKKEKLEPPGSDAIKMPALIHPDNSFARMLVYIMTNRWMGDNIYMACDMDDVYHDSVYKNITQEVLDDWHLTYDNLTTWFPKDSS